MAIENYKGEKYIDTSVALIQQLDDICDHLINNLKTEGYSYTVEEIVKAEHFNKLWKMPFDSTHKIPIRPRYKGIYAFVSVVDFSINFKYMGASRNISRRFQGQLKSHRSVDATWAYLMAQTQYPELNKYDQEDKIKEIQAQIIYPLRFTFFLLRIICFYKWQKCML